MRRPDVDLTLLTFIDTLPEHVRTALCACGHPTVRHWNDGGCGATVLGDLRALNCPCPLGRVECQFHVVRREADPDQLIQVRHIRHIRRLYRRLPPSVAPNISWVVRPTRTSHVAVLFTEFTDALEFATRDWNNPLDVDTRVEV